MGRSKLSAKAVSTKSLKMKTLISLLNIKIIPTKKQSLQTLLFL
jgi:hypothetical protein